jgi:prepilin-type processing-associated H-X9-DG protein
MSSIKNPVDTIAFADAGRVNNPRELNPDLWVEQKGWQLLYFLTPDHPDYAANNPYRTVNRHGNRCVGTWADGHASPDRASIYGFQYYPGKTVNGEVARGDSIDGLGNNKYDPRWKWARER